MASQSKGQKETIERVMHEFKHGELETSHGRKVRNPKQAIAIALSEAGAGNQQSGARNRKQRRRTTEKERRGDTAKDRKEGGGSTSGKSKAALYAEARRRDIPGRSKMDKGELERVLAG